MTVSDDVSLALVSDFLLASFTYPSAALMLTSSVGENRIVLRSTIKSSAPVLHTASASRSSNLLDCSDENTSSILLLSTTTTPFVAVN